jgi:hypothetical protein
MCQRKPPTRGALAYRVLPQGVVAGFPTPQLAFFAILTVAFALLITEKLRNDVVAVPIVIALAPVCWPR